jgi:aminomethyltransferase
LLHGRVVLLTRPRGRTAGLAELLQRQGARVVERPTIAFEPPRDAAPARAAAAAADLYAWIAVTSPQGAEALARAWREARTGAGPARLAAVGRGTARALREQGLAVSLVAEGDAASLGAALRRVARAGERVLVVRPERAGDALPDALAAGGLVVDAVAFYRTVAAADVAETAERLARGEFDAAVFSSPSTFHRLREAGEPVPGFAAALKTLRRVAIGGVTAAALAEAGHPATAVAESPSDAGLLDALRRAFSARIAVLPSGPFPSGGTPSPMTTGSTQRTPLHAVHVAAGARMVEFAGWEMPVQYTGVVDEHQAVRARAGLFDVSHMGEVAVRGAEAEAFLQQVTCNDVAKLVAGRIHYSALMTEAGTFVDDLLVYREAADAFLVVVNAGNAAKDLGVFRSRAAGFDVSVEDHSARYALLAVQGPQAAAILAPRCGDDIRALRYYGFRRTTVDGVPCLVSRTGYTGEDGFEVYAPPEAAEKLWYALLASGAPMGLVPAGLGARDTLRLEACMALYGNDIDDTTTVLEADLGWIVKLDKGDFVGRDVLARQKDEGVSRLLCAFETEGRAVARHGYPAQLEGREVGVVTSGSFSPTLKRNVGMAYLPVRQASPGSRFQVGIRGRAEGAVVVPKPFYKRPKPPAS